MYSLLALACLGGLLACCFRAVPYTWVRDNLAHRLVQSVALFTTCQVIGALILGHLGLLRPWLLTGYCIVMAIILCIFSRGKSEEWHFVPLSHVKAWCATRRGAVAIAAGLSVLVIVLTQVHHDLLIGTQHADGMSYHIPRLLQWRESGHFKPWETPSWQQIGVPVAGDLALGAFVLQDIDVRGAMLPNTLVTLALATGVFVALRNMQVTHWASIMFSLLFFSFPSVGMRLWEFNTDAVAALLTIAGALLLAKSISPVSTAVAWMYFGVAVACKPTVVPAAVVVAVILVVWQRRRYKSSILVSATLVGFLAGGLAVLASYLPVYWAFGDLFGGEFGASHSNLGGGPGQMAKGALFAWVQWLVEPAGYLPNHLRQASLSGWLDILYSKLLTHDVAVDTGLNPTHLFPDRSFGTSRTGVLPLAAATIALVPASFKTGRGVLAMFAAILAVTATGALIAPQAWESRFFVLPMFLVVFFWGVSRNWHTGYMSLMLQAIVVAGGLFGAVSTIYLSSRHFELAGKAGGRWDYPLERQSMNEVLIISDGKRDGRLAGRSLNVTFRYLTCPSDERLKRLSGNSKIDYLAVYHSGEDRLGTGPHWRDARTLRCGDIQVSEITAMLERNQWQLIQHSAVLDLWAKISGK